MTTLKQYEKDLESLKAERTAILKTKKNKVDKKTGAKTSLRDVKALVDINFKIKVTKQELVKLYSEANKTNKGLTSTIKVATIEKKRVLENKVRAKRAK